jgi:hypothetical protein
MIEPQIGGVDLFGPVFVRSLSNQEMPARLEHSPQLAEIHIAGLSDVLEYRLSKDEIKLSRRKGEMTRILDMLEEDLMINPTLVLSPATNTGGVTGA